MQIGKIPNVGVISPDLILSFSQQFDAEEALDQAAQPHTTQSRPEPKAKKKAHPRLVPNNLPVR